MEEFKEFILRLLNSQEIIQYGGLTFLLFVVFAETGLFFGFFLPGDYLLFTAGLLCGRNDFNVSIFTLLISVTLASVAGNFVGYWFGKSVGKALFAKKDTFFFRRSHLERTRKFYQRYGGVTLIAGRFLPIIRTFAPIFAGIIEVDFKKFGLYNFIGGILWVFSLILFGYSLGRTFPGVINYLEYFIIGFLVITTIMVIRAYVKGFKEKS